MSFTPFRKSRFPSPCWINAIQKNDWVHPNFWRQIIVLGLLLVFTLPLGILMKQFVEELDSQIEFAIAERQGLRYNQQLAHLLRGLMVHRELTQRNRPGNEKVRRRSMMPRARRTPFVCLAPHDPIGFGKLAHQITQDALSIDWAM